MENIFDEEKMKQICKELDIEIIEGVKCPQYKDRDMTEEDIKDVFKEDMIIEHEF